MHSVYIFFMNILIHKNERQANMIDHRCDSFDRMNWPRLTFVCVCWTDHSTHSRNICRMWNVDVWERERDAGRTATAANRFVAHNTGAACCKLDVSRVAPREKIHIARGQLKFVRTRLNEHGQQRTNKREYMRTFMSVNIVSGWYGYGFWLWPFCPLWSVRCCCYSGVESILFFASTRLRFWHSTHARLENACCQRKSRLNTILDWMTEYVCVCDGWWVMAERVNDAHTSVSHIEMLNKNDNKIKWCCPSTINDETTIRVATSHSTISVIKLYAIEWNENRTSIDIIDIGGWPLFDVKLPINDVLIEFFCFNLHHFSVVCCCCYYRWLKWQKNKKSSFNWFVGTPQTRVDPNDRRDNAPAIQGWWWPVAKCARSQMENYIDKATNAAAGYRHSIRSK